MSNRRKVLVVALAATLFSASSQACGPFFPQELLSNRTETMLGLPEGNFAYEAQHLVVAGDALRANEMPEYGETREQQRATAEAIGLDEAQRQRLAAARAATDAASAYAAGESLPAASRHYVAGAVAFAAGDLDAAQMHFDAILDLPDAERRTRGVWAAYMSARIAAAQGDEAAANEAFANARRLALAGDADPLGLAVASYGESARLALWRDDYAAAAAGYAEQAARGSRGGATSLLFVARRLTEDPEGLQRSLDDSLVRRLLVAYAFSRPGELDVVAADTYAEPAEAPPGDVAPMTSDRLAALLEQIATRDDVDGKDRLAALAYRAGRYDLAGRLAQGETAPLAAWVRAKLALRAGDPAAAAREYVAAAAAFPADERWRDAPAAPDENAYEDDLDLVRPQCRVNGEHGTLALSRDDYAEAMRLFHAAGEQYLVDATYVAERVLTIDELRAFIDANVPAPPPLPPATADATPTRTPQAERDAQLRDVLARRLLRAERFTDALPYHADDATRDAAKRYGEARARAAKAEGVDAAQAWWEAASLTRFDGMAIMGFQGDPDYAAYGGNFDLMSPGRWDDATNTWVVEPRRDIEIKGPFTSDGERRRVAASVAQPLSRFHYRQLATTFAERAADMVPARSQAFAAMLCGATGWVIADDRARAEALWWRYVKQGPYVPWAADFGHQCQAPDFAGAQARVDLERQRELRRMARRAAPWVAGGFAVIAIAAGAWWFRRRRVPR